MPIVVYFSHYFAGRTFSIVNAAFWLTIMEFALIIFAIVFNKLIRSKKEGRLKKRFNKNEKKMVSKIKEFMDRIHQNHPFNDMKLREMKLKTD